MVPPLLPSVALAAKPLADMPRGQYGRICGLRMTADQVSWLTALGLPLGEEVVVLRQAPFAGPLHVRASSGAEFALDLDCASGIDVVPLAARSFAR